MDASDTMSKQEALKILIEHSFTLSADEKKDLLDKLPTMSAEEIEGVGQLLAYEKVARVNAAPQVIAELEKIEKLASELNRAEGTGFEPA